MPSHAVGQPLRTTVVDNDEVARLEPATKDPKHLLGWLVTRRGDQPLVFTDLTDAVTEACKHLSTISNCKIILE